MKGNIMKYDFLIVGAGLFGSVFAHEAQKRGKTCLLIDKRDHVGGNVFTKEMEGIQVHMYGAHIFHTSNKKIWDYVNAIVPFNRFTNMPLARYKEALYNLPFNMNTFYQMWGTKTPEEARNKIREQVEKCYTEYPSNLEEQAINLVGPDIYEKLIKGYTEKQWGMPATALPAFIIKRLPVRYTFDNNYFNDLYQGIPMGGYTRLIENLLKNVEVRLSTDFFEDRSNLMACADKVVFTGMIDAYFEYSKGHLAYRSLRFEHEVLNQDNFQGNAVVNYTEYEIPFTRIIEHKHFEFGTGSKTVITREYPQNYTLGEEPYYPVNNAENQVIYEAYRTLAKAHEKVLFAGRLAEYKYYDMHQIIERALEEVENCC